jgi:hypothetical protein
LPTNRNTAGFQNNALLLKKINEWKKPPPKKSMSALAMLFSLLSTLGDAGLGLTTYGQAEYKPVWRSLVQSFIGKSKTTSYF